MNKNDQMTGLRFTYESGDYVEDVWKTYPTSEWQTRDIPEGYQIVGMFFTLRPDQRYEQFGFNLLWSDY